MEQKIIYEVRNLKFSYFKKNIIDIKNLTFYGPKIYLIAGSNGSGKTTLLKILNALLKNSEGEIFYKQNKINFNTIKKIREETIFVHQNPYLFKGNVYDNLKFGLKISKFDNNLIDKKINQTLEDLCLEHLKYKKIKELSTGESIIVAIARAYILSREIYLFDEPFSNLDEKSINNIIKLFLKLKQQNKTIIFSSHNLFFKDFFWDEIVYLEKGKIVSI